MSRVSEAMRQAGYQQGHGDGSSVSNDPFVPGEQAVAGGTMNNVSSESAPIAHDEHPPATPAQFHLGTAPRGTTEIRVDEVLRTLYRRRWIIVGVMIGALSIAFVYNATATRIYEARARVLIEPTSDEVVPFRSSGEDVGRSDYFVTQMDVLRSQGLARRTLEQAKMLSSDPARQLAQIGGFIGAVSVSTAQGDLAGSRVVAINYRSRDPKLAATLANGLARAYVDQNLESRRQTSLAAARWLNQRVDELRKEVSDTEGALQRYREQKDAVSLDDRQNVVVQKFSQLNAAVTAARTERVDKETLYKQLVALQDSGAPLDTFPPIQQNGFIQGLKAQLAGLQAERLQLAEKLGDLHPDMIKVTTAIESAQGRLDAETAKVVDGIKNDYANAVAKEHGLGAALDSQSREVLSLNAKSIDYNALQRDANSTQQTFTTVLQRAKETELAAELQTNNIKILDIANVPSRPILPRTQLNLVFALVGGAFLAMVLVFGIEIVHPRIIDPEDIPSSLGLPLLAVAPRIRRLGDKGSTLHELPYPVQEAIRNVRTQLFLAPHAMGTARSYAVTSAIPGEGKTLVATNLAISMSLAGRRVLLVDADLRRPRVHEILNIPKSPGLSNVILGERRPSEALIESSFKGLFVLAAGADVPAPADLLDSQQLAQLLEALRQVFDVVILDCPPVMAVSDASIVANAAAAAVFVVGASTGRDVAQSALDRLALVNANVVGGVLNKAELALRSEYQYPYHTANADA